MRAVLVLGPIAGVAERLAAAGVLAGVRLLAGVRSQMGLEVLQTGVGLAAAFELNQSRKIFFNKKKQNKNAFIEVRFHPGVQR